MFKVNRQDGAAQYINTEGDFVVTVSKVEEALDNKGREVCKVTFKTDDGSSTSDRFINQENTWFRVNQLVAATNHNVPDGTEVDFLGKKGSFGEFIKAMVGLELIIVARFDEYVDQAGDKKKIIRVKNMRAIAPTKTEDNLPY